MVYNDEFCEFVNNLRFNKDIIQLFVTYNHHEKIPFIDAAEYCMEGRENFNQLN